MCSANAQGRSPEGAIEWKAKEGERRLAGRVRNGGGSAGLRDAAAAATGSGAQGGEGRGEGGGSQAALYPDRSPLHTNFLVKEEKMALNPEKSPSPGAQGCQPER